MSKARIENEARGLLEFLSEDIRSRSPRGTEQFKTTRNMNVIGIDVSKLHLDVTLLDRTGKELEHMRIKNTGSRLLALLRLWKYKQAISRVDLVCLEPTGHYHLAIVQALLNAAVPTWIAHPEDIRMSSGMQRGKNDKVDAQRIARYAHRFHDKAVLVTPLYMKSAELRQLLVTRELLVREHAKFKTMRTESVANMAPGSQEMVRPMYDELVEITTRQIAQLNARIELLIKQDEDLERKQALALTVTGVGKVIYSEIVAATQCFTRLSDPREMVCYIGAAPFEHSSGSSIRGKTRVSHKANKRLKSLLHMAALAAMRVEGDLRDYYLRKVEAGKKPMSALNALKAKIIHHLWAVLKSQTPYVRHLQTT